MKKEELIALGLSEEVANKVLAVHLASAQTNTEDSTQHKAEIERLQTELKKRDEQVANLKSFEGDIKAFKQQIEALQKQNKEASEKFESEMLAEKKKFAIKQALTELDKKPHDADLVAGMLDLNALAFDQTGKVVGVKEQCEKIMTEKPFLFTSEVKATSSFNIHEAGSYKKAQEPSKEEHKLGDFGAAIAAKSLRLAGIQTPAQNSIGVNNAQV